MAAKNTSTLALILLLNILLSSSVNACGGGCPYPPSNPTPIRPPNPTPNRPPNPTPNFPPAIPSPTGTGNCPRDALKLGVCATVLGSLVNVTIGTPPVQPCCSLIQGLVDLEAAVCLCIAIKASVLGINLNIPISLSLLLNVCNRQVPNGFQCA